MANVENTPNVENTEVEADNMLQLDWTVDNTCRCGCGTPTASKSKGGFRLFKPGHDARLKGQLIRAGVAGQEVGIREAGMLRLMDPVDLARGISPEIGAMVRKGVELGRNKAMDQLAKQAARDEARAARLEAQRLAKAEREAARKLAAERKADAKAAAAKEAEMAKAASEAEPQAEPKPKATRKPGARKQA